MGKILAYQDFQGGLNDTSSPEDLKDTELIQADNIDLSERGGFTTRKGVIKLNSSTFGYDVTYAFEWLVGNQSKIIGVINNKVCQIQEDGTKIEKLTVQGSKIYPVIIKNILHFSDGTELYTWGDCDFYTSDGVQIVLTGEIVKNSPTSSGGGTEGHFYKAKSSYSDIDLSTQNYADTSKWEDVTDIANVISNVVRPLDAYDPSKKEKASLRITKKADEPGNIVIELDGMTKNISTSGQKEVLSLKITAQPTKTEKVTIVIDGKVTFVNAYANESINALADRIRAFPFEGYTTSGSNDTIIFTADQIGERGNNYFGGGETGATGTITVTTAGSSDSEEGIATNIRATTFNGWTLSGTGKEVIFECNTGKIVEDLIFNSNDTGVVGEYETLVQGKPNDCDLDSIKKCTMFVQHPKSLRIFAGGNPDDPTALYFSEYNRMDYFVEINKVYPRNSEGSITGILPLYQDILVSYNNSWWHYRGIDPDSDAIWEALPIPYGCVSHDSITLTPFSFMFLGKSGIYIVSASILNQDVIMVQSDRMIKNITEGKVENLINGIVSPEKAQGIFHNDKYYLSYCDDSQATRNNKVLAFDWNNKNFVKYTGWEVNSWIKRSNGELLFATDNFILKTGEGYSDVDVSTGNEKAISVKVKTKNYDLKLPINAKFLQNIHLLFKQYKTTESYVNVTLIGDYSMVLINNISLVESLVWGSLWGNVWGFTDYIQKFSEIKKIASRFQLVIENDRLNDPITIYGIGIEYKPLKPRSRRIEMEGGLLE